MTATSYHFKDIVPSPAQNWNRMVPAASIEESHENRNVFNGVLSLGKNIRRPSPMARWSKSDLAGTCLVPAPIKDKVEISGTIGRLRRRAATQSISVSSARRGLNPKGKPR